jgi:hypothetical protein
MDSPMRFSCAIVAGFVSLSISSAQIKPDRKTLIEKKIPGYTLRKIEGFDCLIQEEVIRNNDDVKWKRKPLDVLELELGTVLRVLPKKVETLLKTIVVWVEWISKLRSRSITVCSAGMSRSGRCRKRNIPAK